jgi:hypothetical protein
MTTTDTGGAAGATMAEVATPSPARASHRRQLTAAARGNS